MDNLEPTFLHFWPGFAFASCLLEQFVSAYCLNTAKSVVHDKTFLISKRHWAFKFNFLASVIMPPFCVHLYVWVL